MRGIITSLVISVALVSFAHAEEMEDVIYKTDGSILRGELIEQDFAAGKYKIRLMGGSVFSVNQDEISKITKEPFIVQIPKKALKDESQATVNVQVNQSGVTNTNTNDNQQSQTQTVSNTHYPIPTEYKPETSAFPPHVISFGYSSRNFNSDIEYEEYDYYSGYYHEYEEEVDYDFSGYSIAYQANLTNHFAAYVEYSKTKLDEIKISTNYGFSDTIDPDLDWEIINKQALAILSSNNGKGWQFYVGGGIFRETHKLEGLSSEDMDGQVIMLGSSYAWEKLQAQLRFFAYESDDYEDLTSSGLNLHIALNL